MVGVIGLAGCTSEDRSLPAVTAGSPSVPVLQPGRPGEPNATLTGSAAAPTTTPTASASDARFFQDMIVHHAQALVMVRAVLPDLTDPEVEGIASRIGDEQEPEIGAMARWLEGRGQQVPPEATNPNLTDHGAHSMPGMATAAEVDRLASATGVEADRLFLTLMIRHHRGAIEMIDAHLRNAVDENVEETADDISVTQTKQVGQMQAMLDRLR
ncbi:DUF305 domain-containing protein [Oryzobacter terrae]|uniref:DUF305 domain-containing protein n=1 Tax=Oryzobacter terrae TaxID=1620385 RepID=UPI003670B6EE